MTEKILEWLGSWYQAKCNGDWEHNCGIMIETIDNPGWHISIDTEEAMTKLKSIPWVFVENQVDDWYGYKIQDGKFEASGDPSKIEFLINLFKEIIENEKSSSNLAH